MTIDASQLLVVEMPVIIFCSAAEKKQIRLHFTS